MSLVESTYPIQRAAMFFAGIFALCFLLNGQTPDPLYGTWKLNFAKSTFPGDPPPYKRSTCKIQYWDDGLRITYDMVGTRGGVTHLEWLGKLDGKDYPIQGIDEVVTNAYTQVAARTYEIVVKSDGVKAASARIAIAPDGKTLTSVTSSRNAAGQTVKTTTVYDASDR